MPYITGQHVLWVCGVLVLWWNMFRNAIIFAQPGMAQYMLYRVRSYAGLPVLIWSLERPWTPRGRTRSCRSRAWGVRSTGWSSRTSWSRRTDSAFPIGKGTDYSWGVGGYSVFGQGVGSHVGVSRLWRVLGDLKESQRFVGRKTRLCLILGCYVLRSLPYRKSRDTGQDAGPRWVRRRRQGSDTQIIRRRIITIRWHHLQSTNFYRLAKWCTMFQWSQCANKIFKRSNWNLETGRFCHLPVAVKTHRPTTISRTTMKLLHSPTMTM